METNQDVQVPACITSADGTQRWILPNGELHRSDGPAVERADGTKEWWLHGVRHRIGGPAIERENGSYAWYVHGEWHREDGPAVFSPGGCTSWYLHGKRHREDGPAMIRTDGTKEWYLHGERHRENGPAVEKTDGSKQWWLNGKRMGPRPTEIKVDSEAYSRALGLLGAVVDDLDNYLRSPEDYLPEFFDSVLMAASAALQGLEAMQKKAQASASKRHRQPAADKDKGLGDTSREAA